MREVKPKPKSYVINRHLCLVMDVTRKQLKKIGRWTMGKVRGGGGLDRREGRTVEGGEGHLSGVPLIENTSAVLILLYRPSICRGLSAQPTLIPKLLPDLATVASPDSPLIPPPCSLPTLPRMSPVRAFAADAMTSDGR